MKLADVERAMENVLSTGQLGTPVALRIHAMVPQGAGDLAAVLGALAPLIRLVSVESPGKLLARQHPSGQQTSLLWTDANGRTVFLSLVSTPAARQSLRVLLVGNHGITQLNGGEAWDEPIPPAASPLWQKEIAESLKRGTSIAVGES